MGSFDDIIERYGAGGYTQGLSPKAREYFAQSLPHAEQKIRNIGEALTGRPPTDKQAGIVEQVLRQAGVNPFLVLRQNAVYQTSPAPARLLSRLAAKAGMALYGDRTIQDAKRALGYMEQFEPQDFNPGWYADRERGVPQDQIDAESTAAKAYGLSIVRGIQDVLSDPQVKDKAMKLFMNLGAPDAQVPFVRSTVRWDEVK